MSDFSGLTIGNYKGFTWQASRRKAALPTPGLVHNRWIAVSEEGCGQGSRHHWQGILVSYLHSDPCAFILMSLSEALDRDLLWGLCWGLPMGGGGRTKPWTHVSDLFFPLLAFPPWLPLIPGSIKLPELFVLAPSTGRWAPTSVLIHLTLDWCTVPQRTTKQEKLGLSPVLHACLYHHSKWSKS